MSGSIYAWQIKNPRSIILLFVPVGLLWATQFFLLGTIAAMVVSLICVIKDLVMSFIAPHHAKIIIYVFFVILWSLGLYFLVTPIELLPLITTTLFNLALLQPDNRQLLARVNIASLVLWIAFNFTVGAYMGVLCSFLLVGSTILGMARHEKWQLGKCYRTFITGIMANIFIIPRLKEVHDG